MNYFFHSLPTWRQVKWSIINLALIILIICCASRVYSQSIKSETIYEKKLTSYNYPVPYQVLEDGTNYSKYTYVDRKTKKQVISSYFDEAKLFYQGVAIIKINDLFGLINTKGDFLLPPVYNEITEVNNGVLGFRKGDNYGCITVDGKFITSNKYKLSSYLNEGVIKFQQNGKYGTLDTELKIITPPIYDDISSYWNGIAVYRLNNKEGMLNIKGERVVNNIFDFIAYNGFVAWLCRLPLDGLGHTQVGKAVQTSRFDAGFTLLIGQYTG